MPYTALHSDTGDIHFTGQASANDQYLCIDCEESVEYVQSHFRELANGTETRVTEHFRYSNCVHGTVDSVSDGTGAGGGAGGGGGESELHERRKKAALAEACMRFSASYWDDEVDIGSKRADALLVFEDPHEEYGKGLVIEYQHKNEGKDIQETEKHFAQHEYTTVWLWEDQFTFESSIPDIDLFGGRVYTPWPDAVPKIENWRGIGLAQEKQSEWSRAFDQGLTKSVVEATIPLTEWMEQTDTLIGVAPRLDIDPHFNGDVPLIVNDVTEDTVYMTVNVGDIPDIHEGNAVQPRCNDIDVAVSDVDYYAPMGIWWDETTWYEKFPGALDYPIEDTSDGEPTKPTTSPPFAEWLRSDTDPQSIIQLLESAHANGKHDIPDSRRGRNTARKRVKRIIKHNTGGKQAETVSLRAIKTIGSHSNIPNSLIRWAIDKLSAEGEVEESEPGRYRLAK